MMAVRWKIALRTLLFLLVTISAVAAQSANAPKPGVMGVQVPFASLKPSATLKIGGTADWVLVTDDAVWVAGTKPYSVQHINPITNKIVAKIALPGEASIDRLGKLIAYLKRHGHKSLSADSRVCSHSEQMPEPDCVHTPNN